MGGVTLDLALDLFSERVLGNEGDEGQRVVHGERGGLASVPGGVWCLTGSGSPPPYGSWSALVRTPRPTTVRRVR